jgi:putative nucleotidyltransferase with HDIG domain
MPYHYAKHRRPITDALRHSIVQDLPEITDIADPALRQGAIEAWAYALACSDFGRVADIPPEGNPGMSVLKRGTQADHLRGVAHLALRIMEEFQQTRPEITVDRDIVLTGALCHDVGKPYEFDRANMARWQADPSASGHPTLRHSVFGAHVCLAVGLPEEIAHIALGHSLEGQHIGVSTECLIVRHADHTWWQVAGGLGLLKPESMTNAERMVRARPLATETPPLAAA